LWLARTFRNPFIAKVLRKRDSSTTVVATRGRGVGTRRDSGGTRAVKELNVDGGVAQMQL